MNSATPPMPLLFPIVLLTSGMVWAQPPAIEPITASPSGGYAVAWLDISAALQDAKDKAAPAPQRLIVAASTAWPAWCSWTMT